MIINGEYYDDEEPFGKSALALELHKKFMKFASIGRAEHKVIVCLCDGKPLKGMSELGIKLEGYTLF